MTAELPGYCSTLKSAAEAVGDRHRPPTPQCSVMRRVTTRRPYRSVTV